MSFFSVRSLEHHFPIIENFTTFILSVELLQGLAEKDGMKSKFFVSLSTIL